MILSNECWLKDRCKKQTCGECSFCMKLFKLNELYKFSQLSDTQKIYKELRPDADGTDRDVFIKLKNIENNICDFVSQGKNLYIHSTQVGNGKTAWSIRLIQAFLNEIWWKSDIKCRALFVNVPRFLAALKDNIGTRNEYAEFVKSNIYSADLVVWDEIGTKTPSQFEFDSLLNMINTRLDLGKSNIYTSNLSELEVCQILGDRLHSRIVGYSIGAPFKGKDKRGNNR